MSNRGVSKPIGRQTFRPRTPRHLGWRAQCHSAPRSLMPETGSDRAYAFGARVLIGPHLDFDYWKHQAPNSKSPSGVTDSLMNRVTTLLPSTRHHQVCAYESTLDLADARRATYSVPMMTMPWRVIFATHACCSGGNAASSCAITSARSFLVVRHMLPCPKTFNSPRTGAAGLGNRLPSSRSR